MTGDLISKEFGMKASVPGLMTSVTLQLVEVWTYADMSMLFGIDMT